MKVPNELLLRCFLSVILLVASGCEKKPSVTEDIDFSARRAVLRKQLLEGTPLGSSSASVLQFIRARLAEEGETKIPVAKHPAQGPSAARSEKRGSSVIELDVANERMNPFLLTLGLPLPEGSKLKIQWAFDSQDRLIEIFLDRQSPE